MAVVETEVSVLAESERGRLRITDVKAVEVKNTAGQSLIKVETSEPGLFGVGEAGASGPVARAYLRLLKQALVGEDPLEVGKLYTRMISMANRSSPYRAPVPVISGVDIALWDIAGKALGRPVCSLLSGRLRTAVPAYINSGPRDLLSADACREWAQRVQSASEGWHTVKVTPFGRLEPRFAGAELPDRTGWRVLFAGDWDVLERGFGNCREALGFRTDMIVHCHNEWDLPSAQGLAQAVAASKPLWIEDPLPVEYSDAWRTLKEQSPVRILTGEKLELTQEFLPFLTNRAVDAVQPDLAFAGGISGARKLADVAALYYTPICAHNVGTAVLNMATAHFGASTRNFLMMETRIGQLDLIQEMVEESLRVVNGCLEVPERPGLGFTLRTDVVNANRVQDEPEWS
jgi:L-alanine-DL-glutamate epimerase-like enolase superfamily enzyme